MNIRRGAVPLVATIMIVLAWPAGSANTTITQNGKSVSFADVGGNEWWVQAHITGTDASTVTKMEAQQTGSTAWANLPKQSYGDWAASIHVLPGNQVRFRTTWPDATQIVSCWFTHPAGVEQCGAAPPPPPPPGNWQADPFALVSGFAPDMATADTNGDGRGEFYIASDKGLFAANQTMTQPLSGASGWGAVAAGDLDGDHHAEVYGLRYNDQNGNYEVHQFIRTATSPSGAVSWQDRVVYSASSTAADFSGLSVGDVDHDGHPDLYVVGAFGADAAAWQFRYTASGPFPFTLIMNEPNPTPSSGGSRATAVGLWIGDGNDDGQTDLVVLAAGDYGEGNVYMVDAAASGWSTRFVGPTGDYEYGIVAGDVDGDGHSEIAASGGSSFTLFTPQSGGWVRSTPLTFNGGVGDLFLGDANNDGHQELYLGASDQVDILRHGTSGWTATTIATLPHVIERLIVGDGDGDGIQEAFAIGWDGTSSSNPVSDVSRIQIGPDALGASFTGVRGNEWWEQATVSQSGATISSADIRFNGGAWQPLAHQSWGGWAASYHAVQGTVVQFRATTPSGATLSDCYQWIPQANTDATKVACTGSPPPPTFAATFTLVTGNEWWEQTQVTPSAGATVASVDVRIHTTSWSAWSPLKLQSWGAREWAGSYHAPQGSVVDFRATSTTGATADSVCYGWIPPQSGGSTAAPVACPA